MNGLLTHMALLTLSMSFIILLVLLFIKTFGNRFSAKSRYIVWTILVFSLCIGIGLYKLPSLFTIEVPMPSFVEKATTSETITPVVNAPSTVTPTNPLVQGTNNNTTPSDVDKTVHTLPVVSGDKTLRPDITTIIFCIWTTGAILFFTISFTVYIRSIHKYTRSKKLCEAETEEIFRTVCRRYKIKRIPSLYVCTNVGSPVLYGYMKPTILLPDISFSKNSLVGVLAHELTHYRRGDIWIKLACLIAESLYWFNPLVYIATARCNAAMELSCDESVLAGMAKDVRRSYGNVMLDIVKHCSQKGSILTTQFNPHKNAVKERIMNILDMSKKKRGRSIIITTLVLCLIVGMTVGCTKLTQSPADTVGEDRHETIGSVHTDENDKNSENSETNLIDTSTEVIDETTQSTTSIEELSSILSYSSWYSYYMDGKDYKLYTLDFDISSGKMEWKNGWFESEWENTFAGSFSVDEDGIFHSDLYDELRDTEIQITFTVDVVNATTDKREITFTITDTNLNKYKSLVDKPITFVLDSTPNY